MSYFGNLLNAIIGNTEDVVEQSYHNALNGRDPIDDPSKVSTVYTCLKIRSEATARQPLEIYTNDGKKGKQKNKSHYLYDKLHFAPNNYTTKSDFFRSIEYLRGLKGNAFVRIDRDRRTGRVNYLELLPNSQVEGYKIEGNELYYITRGDGKPKAINAADMLHFRELSKNGIWGYNPIEALRTNIVVTWEAYQTIQNFYQNNATVPKALKSAVEKSVNYSKIQEAAQRFVENFAGSSNAGKIAVLPPNTEVQDMSLSFADAEFINTIKFNKAEIAALYGIPLHLVGLFEASKFNNVEQLQLNFKVNTVAAINYMYRQELEFKLLSFAERKAGASIEFNSMGLVETDHKTKIEALQKLWSMGVVSPNQVAKHTNNEIIEHEAGDLHYTQDQYKPIEHRLDEIKKGLSE